MRNLSYLFPSTNTLSLQSKLLLSTLLPADPPPPALPLLMNASLLLPQGRKGPAFLAYPNFSVYFDWNQSFTYVLTAAYFANRLQGSPIFTPGNPEPGLEGADMKRLQQKLADRGYDVGEIDGILGAGTRAAVQAVQVELGLPADAWPTKALLSML